MKSWNKIRNDDLLFEFSIDFQLDVNFDLIKAELSELRASNQK